MPNLDLNTIELVSTIRTVPENGSASSSDYNDSAREVLADLAAIASLLNDKILALVNSLPDTALLPTNAPVGIEGRTVYGDTSDLNPLFFDNLQSKPLSLADSLRLLNGQLDTFSTQLVDMGIEVASLQTKLASDNRNDIALALQNLNNSLNQAQANIAGNTVSIQTATNRLNNFRGKRVATGTITAGNSANVDVTWTIPFLDNSYTVQISVEDPAGKIRPRCFSYQSTPGVGVTVTVDNVAGTSGSGVIHVTAKYDPEV